ncbi:hypothetical protein Tco_1334297 [Tanacetum coccineum]
MDKLEEQLTKEKIYENDSKTALTALMTSFQSFFHSEFPMYTTLKTRDDFQKYTGKDIQFFKDIMIRDIEVMDMHLIRAIYLEHVIGKRLKLQSKNVQCNPVRMPIYLSWKAMQEGKVNMGKALDTRLFVRKSSGTESDKQDTSSRSGNDTTQAVHANIKLVNDQEPLANVDSNTTPDLTNMRNNRGKTDQDGEQYLVKSPLPASLIDQPTTD